MREARAALAAGELDRASNLLEVRVRTSRDPEVLKLLGEVRHRSGDLPGAGAAWFATSAKGPVVDAAVKAWREHHHDDFGAMWASIPRSAQREPLSPKLQALRDRAGVAEPTSPESTDTSEPKPATASEPDLSSRPTPAPRPTKDTHDRPGSGSGSGSGSRSPTDSTSKSETVENEGSGGFDAAKVIAWVLAALFVLCAVVGLITILQWIVPGS